MKKISLVLLLLAVALSCSKSKGDLSEKIFEEAEKASLNQQIAELNKSLKDAETDAERAGIYTDIALINTEKGNIMATIKSAEEAIKFQPNQYMSHYVLGKSYIGVGRYNDAIIELDKSIALKNDFAPAYFELGNAYYKKFDLKSARDNYRKAIQYDSKFIDAYNNLGAIQVDMGALAEAEKNLMTCIRLNPNYPAAYKNLGILYDTKMGNAAKAIENYNTYLKLRPDCPERNLVKMWISVLKG